MCAAASTHRVVACETPRHIVHDKDKVEAGLGHQRVEAGEEIVKVVRDGAIGVARCKIALCAGGFNQRRRAAQEGKSRRSLPCVTLLPAHPPSTRTVEMRVVNGSVRLAFHSHLREWAERLLKKKKRKPGEGNVELKAVMQAIRGKECVVAVL